MNDKSLFQHFTIKQKPVELPERDGPLGTRDMPKRKYLPPAVPKKKYKLLDKGLITEDIVNKQRYRAMFNQGE